MAIPDIDDYQKLTQKIRASFEIPWVRSKAQQVENDYSLPPPKVHHPEGIPADPVSNDSLPGLQGRTAAENPGICTGPAILGG